MGKTNRTYREKSEIEKCEKIKRLCLAHVTKETLTLMVSNSFSNSSYMRSLGIKSKDDKFDAKGLAMMAAQQSLFTCIVFCLLQLLQDTQKPLRNPRNAGWFNEKSNDG